MTSYANFNTVTFSGRVFNAEIVNGEFLAVTVISNLADGDEGVTITFNNSNGMMGLFQKGFLPVGRQVTVVGRIKSVSETYLDKKSGQTKLRKRPNIHLEGVSIPQGGLGPMPADKTATRAVGAVVAPVDATPKAWGEDQLKKEEDEAYAAVF